MSVPLIRTYGDPVLNSRATEVADIDGKVAALSDLMIETMYAAPGVGLAEPNWRATSGFCLRHWRRPHHHD